MAAVKALEAAEAYFMLGNFEYAIKQAKAAKEFDPDLHGIDSYVTAYQIHSAVSTSKRFALALHPDKNGSMAAEGAFKHVKAAWDVLSDPAKREA
ncbi:unnamed protein product [Malus baccata var. baccata]